MGLVDHRHFDATAQLLEFAERGRLITRRSSRSGPSATSPLPIVVIASVLTGLGVAVLTAGLLAGTLPLTAMGGGVFVASVAMLISALAALRHDNDSELAVDIRPATVLPPGSVKPGNWIERDGAWVRVDEAGRGRRGAISALLSTGDVIELSHPVIVADVPFCPTELHDEPAN